LVRDGVFGSLTDAAVRTLQKQQHLPVDGIVGPRTWAVLEAQAITSENDKVKYYLAQAHVALSYTRGVLSLGNTNRLNIVDNTITSLGENLINQAVQRLVQNLNQDLQGERKIQMIADVGKAARVGNCQECAAIAAVFLRDRKVSPVEFMGLYKNLPLGFGNHAFVVIGREEGDNASRVPPPKEWKGPAVICDPWEGTAYRVGQKAIYGYPGELVASCRW
jgi:hypothetical protein